MSILAVALTVVSSGCVSSSQERQSLTVAPTPRAYYQPKSASALAFDPPVALAGPIPSFSREGRSPAAYAGYEESRVEYHQVYQNDQQNSLSGDRIDRRAYTLRSSVTYR